MFTHTTHSLIKQKVYKFLLNYPDFRMCLQPLASLCEKVIKHNQIEVVKGIIALNTFHDYFINSNRTEVKKLFDALMI